MALRWGNILNYPLNNEKYVVLFGICVHLHYTLHFSLLLKVTIATENLRSLIKIRDLKFSSKKFRDLRSDTLKISILRSKTPWYTPPPPPVVIRLRSASLTWNIKHVSLITSSMHQAKNEWDHLGLVVGQYAHGIGLTD